ncbi:MAG: hypothetical protein M1434_01845 [Chloroflexi bacterium]|nr:hypothetical protein [Chloroflexota bacterium]
MSEDLYFVENNGARAPADPVRITDYRVMPWPDGTRVTVEMGLTPFKVFPAMDISILSIQGEVVRSISLVGAVERRPSPTLHLPPQDNGARMAVLIEMLDGDTVTQQIIVPFEVGGPIIKRVVEA